MLQMKCLFSAFSHLHVVQEATFLQQLIAEYVVLSRARHLAAE